MPYVPKILAFAGSLRENSYNKSTVTGRSAVKREKLPLPPKGAEPVVYAVDVFAADNSPNKIINIERG